MEVFRYIMSKEIVQVILIGVISIWCISAVIWIMMRKDNPSKPLKFMTMITCILLGRSLFFVIEKLIERRNRKGNG